MTEKKEKIKEVAIQETAKPLRGLLLHAFDHPMFGYYAHQLAVGFKHHCPELQVAVVKNNGSLDQLSIDERQIFDYIIEAKDEWIHDGEKFDPLKAKLYMNESSPFQKTLFCDVDMQFTPVLSLLDLFSELDGLKFTIANRGKATGERRTEWMDLSEGEKYGVSDLYDISSEFIYFENADDVFEAAQMVFNEDKIKVDPFDLNKPDEPYLSLGMSIAGVTPHQVPWFPTYWQPYYFTKLHNLEHCYTHYAISFGGAQNMKAIKDRINNLSGYYLYSRGITKQPYPVFDKKDVFKQAREKRRQER